MLPLLSGGTWLAAVIEESHTHWGTLEDNGAAQQWGFVGEVMGRWVGRGAFFIATSMNVSHSISSIDSSSPPILVFEPWASKRQSYPEQLGHRQLS